jgi:hypothetical protein
LSLQFEMSICLKKEKDVEMFYAIFVLFPFFQKRIRCRPPGPLGRKGVRSKRLLACLQYIPVSGNGTRMGTKRTRRETISSPQPDPQRPNLVAPKIKEQHQHDTNSHAGEIESATAVEMMHILQSLVLWPHLRFPKWDPQSASNPTTTPSLI